MDTSPSNASPIADSQPPSTSPLPPRARTRSRPRFTHASAPEIHEELGLGGERGFVRVGQAEATTILSEGDCRGVGVAATPAAFPPWLPVDHGKC